MKTSQDTSAVRYDSYWSGVLRACYDFLKISLCFSRIFFENGLIDEISLVISPCFVGNKEKQLFDNLLLSEKVNLELQGTENAEHGCLSLRYAVKNKD